MTIRDMSNNEAIQMLNRCKHEIIQMRETINQLRPKAEAYDNISTIIRIFFVHPSKGYGEDITWIIQKLIDEMTPKPEVNPVQTPDMPFDLNKTHAQAKSVSIPIGELNKFDPDPYSPKHTTNNNGNVLQQPIDAE